MYPDRPDPSHIDALPNELLAEIFKLGKTNRDSDATLPDEVLYSHVSRRWRDVSTNLPNLWTWIYVDANSSLFRLPHYLSRSQPRRLDICIEHWRLDDRDLEDRKNKIADIMNLLIPHTDRWSRLHVLGSSGYFTYLVLSRLENVSARVLRELQVDFDAEAEVEWMEENSIPFDILKGGAPLLTSIRLDMLQRCWPPMSALTTCGIYQFHRSAACMRFIRALASSHALTKLDVHGNDSCGDSSEFGGLSRIQLDTLKSLWLNTTLHPDLLSPLLFTISAPHLETLTLEGVVNSTLHTLVDSPQRSLVAFPILRTLSLATVRLSNHSCIHLSRMFPSITHLKITGVFPNELRRLAQLIGAPRHLHETDARDTSDGRRVTADIIWPKLRNFNIRCSDLSSDSVDNALHGLLAARRELGRPIEKLVLNDRVLSMEGTDCLGDQEHPPHDEM